jgi:L-lactate dehydrogenase (cytochrome)
MEGLISVCCQTKLGDEVFHSRTIPIAQLGQHVDMAGGATSIGDYFTNMLDPSMVWRDDEGMVKQWNDHFCLKGIISVADAKRAVDIG